MPWFGRHVYCCASPPTASCCPPRYAKFRKLGQFEEWVVKGADWKGTRTDRAAAAGVRTAAGTWAANDAEAAFIESSVDADEAWERLLASKQEWVNRPVQPPGLRRSGIMELAVSAVEARRAKQAAGGPTNGSAAVLETAKQGATV